LGVPARREKTPSWRTPGDNSTDTNCSVKFSQAAGVCARKHGVNSSAHTQAALITVEKSDRFGAGLQRDK
jgi:hypothetical protein